MEIRELMLDGNAIGGLLREVFAEEMTAARSTCAGCGAVREVGALHVYADAPGMVVRCPGCDIVQLRLVRSATRVWLDPRGVSCIEVAMPQA